MRIISALNGTRDAKLSNSDSSYWQIKLTTPLPSNDKAYVRVRFEVHTLGKLWFWKPLKSGAIIDLRECDIREAVSIDEWQSLVELIVPIDDLRVFVVTPWYLPYQVASPNLEYIRLLEGRMWKQYLKRSTSLIKTEKLLIYYWKVEGKYATDSQKPARIFLDINRSFQHATYMEIIGVFVLFVLSCIVAIVLTNSAPSFSLYLTNEYHSFVHHLRTTYLVIAIALVLRLLDHYDILERVVKPRKLRRTLERWLYRNFGN